MFIDNTLSTSIGEFSLTLAKQALLQQDTSNFSSSPPCIFLALAMVHVGTKGTSCDELTKQLGIDFSVIFTSGEFEQHHLALVVKSLFWKMTGRCEIYSKIFARMILNDKYAYILATVFKSAFQVIDFCNKHESVTTINAWVSECTKKRINNLLSESNINDNIAFVLINIIFFKSDWKNKFNAKESYFGNFHKETGSTVEVEFMTQKSIVRLFDDEENRFQTLSLDFKSNDLVGLFFKPSKEKTVKDIISILRHTDLKKCADMSYSSTVKVSVPKFKIQSKFSIKEILCQMGVRDIFDYQRCNLESISDQSLFVDDIVHSSTVEIDEKGVVAAAATAVMVTFCASVQSREFILDSPFLFIIWDRQTNLPLFINAIHDPTQP